MEVFSMDEQEKFMRAQIKKIENDKWFEGEYINRDPGDDFIVDWIYHNAKMFRYSWDISLCKSCSNCRDCGFNAVSACETYVEEFIEGD